MTGRVRFLILFTSFAIVGSACATKSFVEEQISATETKLSATEAKVDQLASTQETRSRETADLARTTRDATDRQLKTLDARVGEVGAVANAAKAEADSVAAAVDATETRLSQRLAGRNRYRVLETRSIYFEAGQAEIRNQDIDELEQIAKVLKGDPNAISELQGFADPRGSDRSNNELSRARVEAVVRPLGQRHGIELRQLQAASMGKAPLPAGEKPTADVLANARRVDIRLLAPWSSWEDSQVQMNDPSEAVGSASPATTEADSPARKKPPATQDAVRDILKTISKEELGGRD